MGDMADAASYLRLNGVDVDYLRKNWTMTEVDKVTCDGQGMIKDIVPKKGSELSKMMYTYTFFSKKQAGLTGSASYNTSSDKWKKNEAKLIEDAIEAANEATDFSFLDKDAKKTKKNVEARLKAAKQVSVWMDDRSTLALLLSHYPFSPLLLFFSFFFF